MSTSDDHPLLLVWYTSQALAPIRGLFNNLELECEVKGTLKWRFALLSLTSFRMSLCVFYLSGPDTQNLVNPLLSLWLGDSKCAASVVSLEEKRSVCQCLFPDRVGSKLGHIFCCLTSCRLRSENMLLSLWKNQSQNGVCYVSPRTCVCCCLPCKRPQAQNKNQGSKWFMTLGGFPKMYVIIKW